MIHFYRGEEFKTIEVNDPLKYHYAVSNYGRLISYTDEFKNGRELKGGTVEGYRSFCYSVRQENGKRKTKAKLICKIVAEYFLPKGNDDQTFVLHLDFNKKNDYVQNLRWANQLELTAHHSKNPEVIKGRAKTLAHNLKADGKKLTSTQVIRIKKMLQREGNKTRLVLIAKQFNITTQQLYRIRTGENWGHIIV